jgi:iron complex transport system ATP-binding protein
MTGNGKGRLEADCLTIGYGAAGSSREDGDSGGARRDAAAGGGSKAAARVRVIASDISFSVDSGDFLVLIGPNGSGKSTLLKTLCGSIKPAAGVVRFGGVPVSALPARERARGIGVVLTDRIAAGFLTARELAGLGRYPHTDWTGALSRADREAVDRALEMAGASGLADRAVTRLSDGERQRTMIARALAQEPAVLLLDEPTAFLDIRGKAEIMALLRSLAHDHGRGILLSTHDLDLAMRLADRLILIDSRGHVSMGAPEDLVLAGELERVFSSSEAPFDPGTGSFSFPKAFRGTAVVSSERPEGGGQPARSTDAAAYWVGRALERIWYRVERATRQAGLKEREADAGFIQISVDVSVEEGIVFRLSSKAGGTGAPAELRSIAELLERMRSLP